MKRFYGPKGGLSDLATVDISSSAHEDSEGFYFSCDAGGDAVFRTLGGSADITRTYAAGEGPSHHGIPVLCVAVRANATIAAITVSKP